MATGMIDKNRLIFPGLAGFYDALAPASYSFMRFATGAVLVPHGIQKIMLGSAVTLAPYIAKQTGVPFPLCGLTSPSSLNRRQPSALRSDSSRALPP